MVKRDEEEAIEAVAFDSSIFLNNRKLKLSAGVWSAVDSDLQKVGDVSGCRQASSVIKNDLSSGSIPVSFEICF